MRFLKIVVAFVSFLMLSQTLEAVVTRPSEEYLAERLGVAASAAFAASKHSALKPHMLDHEDFFHENMGDLQQLDELLPVVFARSVPKRPEDEAREKDALAQWKETCARIGRKYLENPAPLMDTLAAVTDKGGINNDTYPSAYHRVYLLLNGVGVDEGQQEIARATAFSLIKEVLEYQKDGLANHMVEFLFRFFLPDNTLALEYLRRLNLAIETETKYASRHHMEYEPDSRQVKLLKIAQEAMGEGEGSQ